MRILIPQFIGLLVLTPLLRAMNNPWAWRIDTPLDVTVNLRKNGLCIQVNISCWEPYKNGKYKMVFVSQKVFSPDARIQEVNSQLYTELLDMAPSWKNPKIPERKFDGLIDSTERKKLSKFCKNVTVALDNFKTMWNQANKDKQMTRTPAPATENLEANRKMKAVNKLTRRMLRAARVARAQQRPGNHVAAGDPVDHGVHCAVDVVDAGDVSSSATARKALNRRSATYPFAADARKQAERLCSLQDCDGAETSEKRASV